MNKKIIVILILLIFVVCGAILIVVNNKNTKTNKTDQDDISYNEVYSNNDVMNYTNNTNTGNENILTNQVQESQINTILNEQTSKINSTENEISSKKNDKEESSKVENIKIKVNNNVLNVKLENNSSVDSLIKKLKQGHITINAHEYGNFEKVGSLGFSLPTNDTQIRTTVGDVMLYQGNQITLFYGSNSWSYTRLGKIVGISESELKDILGTGNVTFVLSID